ncbi:MAG TPA: Ig-like domain-containing protein, partial [Gemmatimonadales bacterium]
MSKAYRSLLWSGLVVAGVAACGDDVTVNPPEPTVHSISVAPDGVTVGIGANVITMSAAVNADAGVTNLAVTWSTSDNTKATVSQTGQVTTLAVGSVAIIACSQLVPSVCGNATINIVAAAPTQVSIDHIEQGGNLVNLGNVSGQVDAVLNVDPGAGSLVKVQVLIDGVVAAEQCFIVTCPVSLRAEPPAANAVQQVTLSFNTNQV